MARNPENSESRSKQSDERSTWAEVESRPWSERQRTAFSLITPQDEEYFKHIDNKAKLSAFIDNIEFEELGTAITIAEKSFEADEEDEEEGGELDGREVYGSTLLTSAMTVGYALPLNEEKTRHLMIFKNGKFLITEPFPPPSGKKDNEKNIKNYQELFARPYMELQPTEDNNAPFGKQINQVMFRIGEEKAQIVREGRATSHKTEIKNALEISRSIKEKERRAMDQDMEDLFEEAVRFDIPAQQIFPDKEPPNDLEAPNDPAK